MIEHCHRCGGELPKGSGETPFCPHCGAPQLFLALENQSAETGGEPAGEGAPATTGRTPPPRPQQVDWKTAIRCAVLVAGIGSVLALGALKVDLLSPVSLLWIMSASLITLGLYQKRRPSAWIDARVGARIGVLVGLCLALGLGTVFAGCGVVARFWLHSMGSFDSAMAAQLAEAERRSATPVPPEMVGFVSSPQFRAGMMLGAFGFGSACLLVLSMLGGAFGGLLRTRRGPA